jgi:23S rRNA pseudouridine2605 synthase
MNCQTCLNTSPLAKTTSCLNNMIRLHKLLAQAGIASRRKAELLIQEGRVKVDGQVVTQMGTQVTLKQVVTFDDKPLILEPKVYYLLNKPRRIISSVSDDRDRTTVVDLLPKDLRIFPVGRLDYDTSGALILTNDGDFANALTHPSFHLEKSYEVKIKGFLTLEQIKALEKGVYLDEFIKTLPAHIDYVKQNRKLNQTDFVLVLKEGRYHQVKRMMEFFGHEVIKLHRSKIAFIDVKDLAEGMYRPLKVYEIKKLKHIAHLGVDK